MMSGMDTLFGFLPYLLYLAMAATVFALFVGVFAMARGGKFHDKYSNKLMRMRIGFQALALAALSLLLLLSKYVGPPGGAH